MSEFVQSLLDRLSGEEPAAAAVRPQLPSRFEPFSLSPDPWTDGGAEPESDSEAAASPLAEASAERAAARGPAHNPALAWTPPTSPYVPSPTAFDPAPEAGRAPLPAPPRWEAPDFVSPPPAVPRQAGDASLLDERFRQLDLTMARLRRDRTTPAIVPLAPEAEPRLPPVETVRSPAAETAVIEIPPPEPSLSRSTGDPPDGAQPRPLPPRLVPAFEPLANDRRRESESGNLVQERLQRLEREIARLRGSAAREGSRSVPPVPPDPAPTQDGAEVAARRLAAPAIDRAPPESAAVSPPSAWPDIPRVEALETESTAPSVTISIGRIEIRAPRPAPPATAARAPARPSRIVSLDDYLRQRGGGERS